MCTFDVRKNEEKEIREIIFADRKSQGIGASQASSLEPWPLQFGFVMIRDFSEENYEQDEDSYVLVSTKAHAENLIKALDKAIDLGWLK